MSYFKLEIKLSYLILIYIYIYSKLYLYNQIHMEIIFLKIVYTNVFFY